MPAYVYPYILRPFSTHSAPFQKGIISYIIYFSGLG